MRHTRRATTPHKGEKAMGTVTDEELTRRENVLGCSNGKKSRPPRFDDIGIESNGAVAGRDFNMH
jgi:hypothetical protein